MSTTGNSLTVRTSCHPDSTKSRERKRRKIYLRGRQALSLLLLCALAFLTLAITGCGAGTDVESTPQKETIILGDASWDSIQVHNRIAGFIIEHGYSYPVDYIFGETLPLLQGLSTGGIDIYMEVWTDNIIEAWEKVLAEGTAQDLGPIFPDAPQGWYVPTYMIEGDPARGIEATAPNLRSVFDLPEYKDLFTDPEVTSKGRFHNSPPGWVCTAINEEKFSAYELNEAFNLFSTGSDTALATSMVSAYEKGEPWVGYYWEPTWVMGKLDMTLLEEPPYDPEVWEKNKGCAYPAAKVQKGIHSELQDSAPDVVEFIKNYTTTLQQNNELLAYMIENDGDIEKAAHYFFENYTEIWKSWLPEDITVKVEKALGEV
ncbi:MAG: ABC transporter substrate-binding protein [Dethiobacteria bacterium]|jgi:glycine betaine/proline transport system substrate-binding protein